VSKVTSLASNSVKATVPCLKIAWKYAKVELRPPGPREFLAIPKGFANLISAAKAKRWQHLTVKEAAVNTMVTAEVICWFFIGECIGKGSLVGYQVPGAFDFEAHI